MRSQLEPRYLTPIQQYLRFAERGMHFNQATRVEDIKRISVIGYYKLKEYAYAMSDYDQYGNLYYRNTSFRNVVKKYYRDRRLKLALFNGIEEIEPYLVSTLVSILGKRYGAFGYWNVKNWSDRTLSLSRVEQFEQKFHRDILRGTRYSTLDDLTIQSDQNLSPNGGFPTIWLLGDFITFGTAVAVLQIMSINNRRSVATRFGCTADELVSWMRTLNFVRNQCAHNHDLIDIRLETMPQTSESIRSRIVLEHGMPSNRIAVVLVIFSKLMKAVDKNFDFYELNSAIFDFFQDANFNVHRIGFKDFEQMRLP